MQNSSRICVDASLVVRFVGHQPDINVVETWRQWIINEIVFVAPSLLRYEVVNALYMAHRFGNVPLADLEAALIAADGLPITYETEAQDHAIAFQYAARLNLRAAYDAHYLALAERLGIEFWTADERLYNSVRHHLPWVHLVGAASED